MTSIKIEVTDAMREAAKSAYAHSEINYDWSDISGPSQHTTGMQAALTAAFQHPEFLAQIEPEWLPIESAPAVFIGYEPGDFGPEIYGACRGPFGDIKLLADPEIEMNPTHWMPMPEPPRASLARLLGDES